MLVLAVGTPALASAASDRFSGQVTDSLRTPTHRLLANAASGRASADLVFVDHAHAGTTVHTCVRRRDVDGVRTCFNVVTGDAGVQSVTPLRFPRGKYAVRWSVHGEVVARWRFVVVSGH